MKTENNRIVLKASAGTGKTYRLSLEFIGNLIKNIDYKDIVVMTFTKKATAEIKERIYDFLYQISFSKGKGYELEESLKSLYNFTDSDINKKKLQNIYFEMIKNKEDIRIYTIDGFTNRIFKTAIAPSLGIYNYEILDKEDDIFYSDILSKIIDKEDYFKKFEFIIKEKGDKKKIDTYINFIKDMIELQKNYLLSSDYKNRENAKIDYIFLNYIEEIFKNIESMAALKNSKSKKEIKPVTNYIKKEYESIYKDFKFIDVKIEKDIIENKREKIEVLLKNWSSLYGKNLESSPNMWDGRKLRGKEIADEIEEMSNNKEAFLKSFSKYIYSEKILPLHNKIENFSNDVYKLVEREKMSSKKFTHDDISTYTYKFIFDEKLKFIENGKATEEFLDLIGGKIETIMIDEFQDTSILQWKILNLLISNSRNVICVGDEKQSIYSWRGGEKELFEKLEKIINGRVENLRKSYRSYKEIIKNVNIIYEDYSKDWSYTPVEYREDEDYQKGYFSYNIQEISNKEDQRDYIKSYETIITMIKNREIKNLGKSCIICRKNNHLSEIVQRLNEENIPYTLNSSSSILEHGAIKPIYKLMKYFIFNNLTYLLEFIRSDLIGGLNSHVKYILENKRDIENYIRGYGEIDEFSKFVESNNKKELTEYFEINKLERNNILFSDVLFKIRKLKYLSKNLNDISLKENFSREIVEKFEITKYYSTNSDIKNIFNFFNILKGYNDLFEFITYMEDERDKITQLSSGDVDAINLMTIHKSKGLEFDTVFYYKRDSFAGDMDSNEIIPYLKYDENFQDVDKFLVILKKYKKSFIDGYYFDLQEELKRKKEIEETNGDYVALTRAKKNLILLFDVLIKDGEYKNKLATKLVEKYSGNKNYFIGKIVENNKEKITSEVEEYDELDKIIPYFSDNISKLSKNENKVNLEKEFKRKKGLAMHYYFEHILNNVHEDKKTAKSAILNKYGNILGKSILNELIKRMDKFISGNKKIYDSKYEIYTEFEIYDNEGKRKIIDRINVDKNKNEIYIYDYKTGYEPQENEKYKEQIENYKKIMKEKLGEEYKIYTEILEV